MEEQGKYDIEAEVAEARTLIGWDRPIKIMDEGDLRKYRIEIPNLYDDAELDPFEFRLLVHYKRVGNCTESTRTTSTICNMSPMSVSDKRKTLAKKGFIRLEKIFKSKYEFSYRITVIDRWQENFLKYAPVRQAYTPRTPRSDKESTTTANLFQLYESNIGILTPMVADVLEEAEKTYPADWLRDAIQLAVENNKRNWRYCEAILKRWKESGKDDGKRKPKEAEVSEYETIGL